MISEETKAGLMKTGIGVGGAAGAKALEVADQMTMSEWAAAATVAFMVLQGYFLVRNQWWRDPESQRDFRGFLRWLWRLFRKKAKTGIED